MARVNKTRFAILGCLSVKPMSAYEIKTFMARSTAYFWMEHEAQLYPNIKKLHEQGVIDCQEEVAQKAGMRKVYHINELGLELLQEWLKQKSATMLYRNEFLLKLFFGNNVSTAVTLERIKTKQIELQQELAMYQALQKEFAQLPEFERKRFALITLLYGIRLTEAELAWCDEAMKIIEQE